MLKKIIRQCRKKDYWSWRYNTKDLKRLTERKKTVVNCKTTSSDPTWAIRVPKGKKRRVLLWQRKSRKRKEGDYYGR